MGDVARREVLKWARGYAKARARSKQTVEPEIAANPSVFPDNYLAALAALKTCAKDFTPENYLRAAIALEACEETDECEAWTDESRKLWSYAKMANDDNMERLIRRVEKRRAEWKASQT